MNKIGPRSNPELFEKQNLKLVAVVDELPHSQLDNMTFVLELAVPRAAAACFVLFHVQHLADRTHFEGTGVSPLNQKLRCGWS